MSRVVVIGARGGLGAAAWGPHGTAGGLDRTKVPHFDGPETFGVTAQSRLV